MCYPLHEDRAQDPWRGARAAQSARTMRSPRKGHPPGSLFGSETPLVSQAPSRDPRKRQWNTVFMLWDKAARGADGHEAGTVLRSAASPSTLFLSSKPAHTRWESPENKFPEKTYGAYSPRRSANETNWGEGKGWLAQSRKEVRFGLEDASRPHAGAPERSLPGRHRPTSGWHNLPHQEWPLPGLTALHRPRTQSLLSPLENRQLNTSHCWVCFGGYWLLKIYRRWRDVRARAVPMAHWTLASGPARVSRRRRLSMHQLVFKNMLFTIRSRCSLNSNVKIQAFYFLLTD